MIYDSSSICDQVQSPTPFRPYRSSAPAVPQLFLGVTMAASGAADLMFLSIPTARETHVLPSATPFVVSCSSSEVLVTPQPGAWPRDSWRRH